MKHSVLLVAILTLASCGQQATKTAPPPAKQTPPADSSHSHERGKMMLVDAGPYHALLTAHLSPKGNELDIFFETPVDKNPQPQAVPLASIKAFIKRGDEEAKEVVFEPAPADERPSGEKSGSCSHFVAKVPWMQATDKLTVTFDLEVNGERHRVTWENFVPKKYAHHEE